LEQICVNIYIFGINILAVIVLQQFILSVIRQLHNRFVDPQNFPTVDSDPMPIAEFWKAARMYLTSVLTFWMGVIYFHFDTLYWLPKNLW